MTRVPRTLGLLGGMGPAATADVLAKIVRATPAVRDQDHIPILVRCVPQIPDRTEALFGRGPSPADALAEGAAALRRAGAEFLAIACNTAHHWHEAVRQASGLPVIHIGEAVVERLRAGGGRGPVGLLATQGTLVSGFHQRHLTAAGYEVLTPDEAEAETVERAIALAKAGDWPGAQAAARAAADGLAARGAGRIVLACTELPLALTGGAGGPELIDANMALAEACVRAALAPPATAAA